MANARREAVAHLRTSLEVSERRACTILAADWSVIRYRARRPDDGALRARLRELADQRRRFGYRRLHVLLRGEGWAAGRKKTQRLYREEGLTGPDGATASVAAPDRGCVAIVARTDGATMATADPEGGWAEQPLVDGLRP